MSKEIFESYGLVLKQFNNNDDYTENLKMMVPLYQKRCKYNGKDDTLVECEKHIKYLLEHPNFGNYVLLYNQNNSILRGFCFYSNTPHSNVHIFDMNCLYITDHETMLKHLLELDPIKTFKNVEVLIHKDDSQQIDLYEKYGFKYNESINDILDEEIENDEDDSDPDNFKMEYFYYIKKNNGD